MFFTVRSFFLPSSCRLRTRARILIIVCLACLAPWPYYCYLLDTVPVGIEGLLGAFRVLWEISMFLLRQGNSEDYCRLCLSWLFISYPLSMKVFCRFCTGHLVESYGFISVKKNIQCQWWIEYGTLVELTLENRSPRRKTSPSATLPPQIPYGLNRGSYLGLRSERPATNGLSHGTGRSCGVIAEHGV